MNKAVIHDVELAYRDLGNGNKTGAPVVFLHAFPLNQTMWDDQVKYLSPGRRVITFDWRGFGGSSLGAEPTTMGRFADDLAGLLRRLEVERAVVCGLSMGGYAAFAFYKKYASMVAALILADTRAGVDTEAGKQNRHATAALARKSGPGALVDVMTPKLLGPAALRDDSPIVGRRPAERVREMIESNSAEGVAQASLAMAARDDSTDLLGEIRCPSLVIVGAEDGLTPPGEAEKMSRGIPRAGLRIIPDAGHLSNLERPDDFNVAIAEFIAELR
jgi:pimeloyl-ACP methyl ester carboxylesterase